MAGSPYIDHTEMLGVGCVKVFLCEYSTKCQYECEWNVVCHDVVYGRPESIEKAVGMCLNGTVQGICTAPISKEGERCHEHVVAGSHRKGSRYYHNYGEKE